MNKKQTRLSRIRFFGIIVISGILGGVVGIVTAASQHTLKEILNILGSSLVENAEYITIFSGLIFSILCYLLYRIAKKEVRLWDRDDCDYIEKTEDKLSIGLLLSEVGLIFTITFFAASNFAPSKKPMSLSHIYGILFFIVIAVFLALMQQKLVQLEREINPEKQGDPLDFGFQKKWLKSCDELEKQVMYKASYKAFRVTQYAYAATLLILMVLSPFCNIGVFPIFLVGFFWFLQVFTYTVTSLRISHAKHHKQHR